MEIIFCWYLGRFVNVFDAKTHTPFFVWLLAVVLDLCAASSMPTYRVQSLGILNTLLIFSLEYTTSCIVCC